MGIIEQIQEAQKTKLKQSTITSIDNFLDNPTKDIPQAILEFSESVMAAYYYAKNKKYTW